MPQVGSPFIYNGRKPLDSRQLCDSFAELQSNEKKILYPPGFRVYCIAEKQEYRNTAPLGEPPVWEEFSVQKAYIRQTKEPTNKDLMWFREEDLEVVDIEDYSKEDLLNMIKTQKAIVESLQVVVLQLQKDVAYLKKHGTVVNPDTNIEGALITDDGCYLMTDDGCYLVV